MPLTFKTMFGSIFLLTAEGNLRRGRLAAPYPSRLAGGARGGCRKYLAPCQRIDEVDQDWQSAGVRGASFFSAAYFCAVALTSGLITCSSACSQSLVNCHLAPSQVWMRAQAEPMWSAHEV